MLRAVVMIGFLGTTACTGDETVAAYGGGGQIWTLVELDGVLFAPTATLAFPEPGKISGRGPCNTYTGEMAAPYPWFDAQNVTITHRACPDPKADAAFFAALTDVSQSEVAGDTMILRNEAGREMVFTASE